MIKVFDWKKKIVEEELDDVVRKLEDGEIIVFPTETVYGIGGNALDGEVAKKIYAAKGRPSDNPLIVHVSDLVMLEKCVSNISEIERKLINDFMPGPFTLILNKANDIPMEVTANLDTVAIRMPSNQIANKIIEKLNKPIAAPSANISGKPSGTNIDDIKEELGERVYALIDGGNTDIGLESTVVKVIDGVPTILRPGAITADDIKNAVGLVKIDEHVLNEVKDNEIVESPGMKHKHYSPNTECLLIDIREKDKRIEKINQLIDDNVCVIGFEKDRLFIDTNNFLSVGNTLDEMSKNIFRLLRKADKLNCKLIIIEGVSSEGLGLAVMNRLIRTCNYNVIGAND